MKNENPRQAAFSASCRESLYYTLNVAMYFTDAACSIWAKIATLRREKNQMKPEIKATTEAPTGTSSSASPGQEKGDHTLRYENVVALPADRHTVSAGRDTGDALRRKQRQGSRFRGVGGAAALSRRIFPFNRRCPFDLDHFVCADIPDYALCLQNLHVDRREYAFENKKPPRT